MGYGQGVMRFKPTIIKGNVPGHVKVRKAAMISIAFNILEIIAGLTMIVLVNRMLAGGVEAGLARLTTLLCVTIVGWGAVSDISAAITSLNLVQRTKELEEAYGQLEDLNREMRAQRHDFMNHLQVVYSLIEMNEPGEAMDYMDRIYGDMQRVSRMLRTACPAVNALIQAKLVEASERGAELKLSIAAKWDDELMPAWEICRVLANLIDNALDAACSAEHPEGVKPTVELVLGEDLRSWFSPCAITGLPSAKRQRRGYLNRDLPPRRRDRAWAFTSSARQSRKWADRSRWNRAMAIRFSRALCPESA